MGIAFAVVLSIDNQPPAIRSVNAARHRNPRDPSTDHLPALRCFFFALGLVKLVLGTAAAQLRHGIMRYPYRVSVQHPVAKEKRSIGLLILEPRTASPGPGLQTSPYIPSCAQLALSFTLPYLRPCIDLT